MNILQGWHLKTTRSIQEGILVSEPQSWGILEFLFTQAAQTKADPGNSD